MAVKVGIITGTLWLHVFLMWKTRDRYLTEINFTGSSCYARLFNNHVLKTINNEAKFRSQCRIGRTPGLVAGNGACVW